MSENNNNQYALGDSGLTDQKVAVLDLDGTITRGDTYVQFLLFYLKKKPQRLLRAPILPVYLLMYKLGLRSNHWLKARFLRTVVAGVSSTELALLSSQFVERTMRWEIKPKALQELDELRGEGYLLVLATASFSFYVEGLFAALGMDELLCTVAQLDSNGILTGEIDGKNCIGEEKAKRIHQLLVRRNLNQVHKSYSDSSIDLPMLKMAAVALVVDPGKTTAEIADSLGYQILRWN